MNKIFLHSEGLNWSGNDLPGMETDQDLTIEENGRIHFVSYCKDSKQETAVLRHEERKLSKKDTETIFQLLLKVESQPKISYVANWTLEINGKQTTGPMNGKVIVDDINVTELIRDKIDIHNLFVFSNLERDDIGMNYCCE